MQSALLTTVYAMIADYLMHQSHQMILMHMQVGNFTLAIYRSLRKGTIKSIQVTVEFFHEIFKYLTK